MIEAGLEIDEKKSFEDIITLYEKIGWENQKVFDVFLENSIGYVDNKFLSVCWNSCVSPCKRSKSISIPKC